MARKRKIRDEDDDDDILDDEQKPKNDAYVGMLAITFLTLAVSAALFYMDFESLNEQSVQPPSVNLPALGQIADSKS